MNAAVILTGLLIGLVLLVAVSALVSDRVRSKAKDLKKANKVKAESYFFKSYAFSVKVGDKEYGASRIKFEDGAVVVHSALKVGEKPLSQAVREACATQDDPYAFLIIIKSGTGSDTNRLVLDVIAGGIEVVYTDLDAIRNDVFEEVCRFYAAEYKMITVNT